MKFATMPVISGALLGVLAPILVYFGNPKNMGVCAACFTRDIAGALNLHQMQATQYIRPEIIGIVIGAFIASLIFSEFKGRGGSSPVIRFMLGIFAMIGALVFLGCPWRLFLRLSAGDLSAIAGLFGLVGGIIVGSFFIKRGFSLGSKKELNKFSGFGFLFFIIALLLFFAWKVFGDNSPISFSTKGPGAAHAPFLLSIVAGISIGFIFQRSRFCTIGAFKNIYLIKDSAMLQGVIALLVAAFITNLAFGFFSLGFTNQPIAHNNILWNFLSMLLCGLAFSLGGGCPGRQLVLAGEGDNDAGIFILGLLLGGAIAHNFNLASSANGITANAPTAVLLGIAFCLIVAFFAKEKK